MGPNNIQNKRHTLRAQNQRQEKEHPMSSLIMMWLVLQMTSDWPYADIWVIHNHSCEAFSYNFCSHLQYKVDCESTQQSILGFLKILGTETKILNVKSTDWETNLCTDHYWNWDIHDHKEDHGVVIAASLLWVTESPFIRAFF